MKLNDIQKNYINEKLINLNKSKFRNSFHLRKYMYEYIDEVGFEKLEEHALDFINKRLVKYDIEKD